MKIEKLLLDEKAELLKILGHPIRLCIIKGLIEEGENNVSFMQNCLEIPQSTLSQHLSKLRTLGIIEGVRKGTEVYYRVINEDAERIVKMLF